MNHLSDRLYGPTVALIIAGLLVGCGHACIAQEKFHIKHWVDSVQVPKASWDVDTVLVKGDKNCNHEWLTQFETQKYEGIADSLRTVLNPNSERVVQEVCVICDRQRIKSETITFVWRKKKQ